MAKQKGTPRPLLNAWSMGGVPIPDPARAAGGGGRRRQWRSRVALQSARPRARAGGHSAAIRSPRLQDKGEALPSVAPPPPFVHAYVLRAPASPLAHVAILRATSSSLPSYHGPAPPPGASRSRQHCPERPFWPSHWCCCSPLLIFISAR